MNRTPFLFLILLILLSGCHQIEDYHYVYKASSALYDERNNEWIVKFYGPKEIDIESSRDALSMYNIEKVYRQLVGEISYDVYSPISGDTYDDLHSLDQKIKIPYNDFTFGYLHLEYYDQYAASGKKKIANYFLESSKDGVAFLEQPLHFDPAIVYEIVQSARTVN